MSTKKHTLCIIFCLLLNLTVIAQDSTDQYDNNIQQQLESIAEQSESEENDYTALLEQWDYYRLNPINLNKTTFEELQKINLLSDIQINNLLDHIDKNGKLMVVYELQTIEGFDKTTINRLLPFVYVLDKLETPNYQLRDVFSNGQHTLLFRYSQVLEEQKGFLPIDSSSLANSKNSRYIGSPQKVYARYHFNYNNRVQWGITAEKDPGELFFKNNQRFTYDWYNKSLNNNLHNGFDFYSAHLVLNDISIFKTVALGDYQITFGQGLTAWSGFAFGKSSNSTNAKRVASGIMPYKSVDENNFLRGAATSIRYKQFETSIFASRKKIDGNISDTSSTGEALAVSSLQTTGIHATPSEIYDKHSVTQTITGGNISYKTRKLSLGITAVDCLLDKAYNRDLSAYNQFQFSDKHNFNAGVDYNLVLRNFNFFGEQAISKNGGMAFLNGVLIYLDPRVSMTILHRNYQRNYQNQMSNAFAQNTLNANEKGVYTGITLQPLKKVTLYAYYDRVEFPWLKYQVNAPSVGNEWLTQLVYTPSKKTEIYLRVRNQHKQKNTNNEDALIDYIVPVNQTNYRLNISYTMNSNLKLRSRVELVKYQLAGDDVENGYLTYQDIIYNKMGSPFSYTLRYALFETDSYNSRIYAYENDVPSSFSIPANYYRGSRFYAMLNYDVSKNLKVWLRYSQTFYDNKKIIGEGSLTEIQGNTKSEIKAQVMWTF